MRGTDVASLGVRKPVGSDVAGHRGVVAALTYARALSEDVTAVCVSTDPAQTEAIGKKWELWGGGVRLVVVDSPYRLLVEPLVEYIRQVAARREPNEVMTVVVPQFVPEKRWHNLLHAQTGMLLRLALMFEPGIVITNVPYQVGENEREDSRLRAGLSGVRGTSWPHQTAPGRSGRYGAKCLLAGW